MCNNLIDKLSKYNKITILPHDNCDVDSVISAILLSKLLKYHNIENEILIFDEKIEEWTNYFLVKLGYNLSQFLTRKEDKNRKLFLVDHHKTIHAGEVLGCIDHHLSADDITYDYYLNKHSCSAAYIIYKIMMDLSVPIDKKTIEMVGYATLIDTCSFKSTKTILKEKEELLQLLKQHDFDIEFMLNECLCLNDIANMSNYEIARNGLKVYDFAGYKVKSSYVQIDNLDIPKEVITYIQSLVITENIYMWAFIVSDLKHERSNVYKITKESIIIEMYDKIMSRGKDIIPAIEKEILTKNFKVIEN